MVLLKQMVHVTSNTYASSTHEETKTPNTLDRESRTNVKDGK